MKKRTTKVLSSLLISAMTVGMLAGCGSKGDTPATASQSSQTASGAESSGAESSANASDVAADTSEHVDLKMYLIGERTPDFDEVYGKINEIL